MARSANGNSANYLRTANAPVSTYPCSISFWFNTSDNTKQQQCVWINDTGSLQNILIYLLTTGAFRILARGTGSNKVANTSTTVSNNTWHHVFGMVEDATWQSIYIDNAGEGRFNGGANPSGLNQITLLGSGSADPVYGTGMAHLGIWNAKLDASERLALSQGYSPDQIRPESLKVHDELFGNGAGNEPDIVSGDIYIETGTVTSSNDGPAIIMPAAEIFRFPKPAVNTMNYTLIASNTDAKLIYSGA